MSELMRLDAEWQAKRSESIRIESEFCSGKRYTNAEMNQASFDASDAADILKEELWRAWPQIKRLLDATRNGENA